MTVANPTTVNTDVLPEAFREALRADLAAQRSVTPDASPWLTLHDAVAVCTRQLRMHGYYPEKALVVIKSAVCDAAVPLVADDLMTEIVHEASQSCITAYFEAEIDQRGSASGPERTVRVPPWVETPGTTQMPTSLDIGRRLGEPFAL